MKELISLADSIDFFARIRALDFLAETESLDKSLKIAFFVLPTLSSAYMSEEGIPDDTKEPLRAVYRLAVRAFSDPDLREYIDDQALDIVKSGDTGNRELIQEVNSVHGGEAEDAWNTIFEDLEIPEIES